MNKESTDLKNKITSNVATVAVLGLGYVGLPLALELSGAGFKVIGIDVDEKKVALINNLRVKSFPLSMQHHRHTGVNAVVVWS